MQFSVDVENIGSCSFLEVTCDRILGKLYRFRMLEKQCESSGDFLSTEKLRKGELAAEAETYSLTSLTIRPTVN